MKMQQNNMQSVAECFLFKICRQTICSFHYFLRISALNRFGILNKLKLVMIFDECVSKLFFDIFKEMRHVVKIACCGNEGNILISICWSLNY